MANILGATGRVRLLAALPDPEKAKFTVGESGFMNGVRRVSDATMLGLYSEGHGDELLHLLLTPIENEGEILAHLFPDPADLPALAMGDARRA